jgi:hypothetical protein
MGRSAKASLAQGTLDANCSLCSITKKKRKDTGLIHSTNLSHYNSGQRLVSSEPLDPWLDTGEGYREERHHPRNRYTALALDQSSIHTIGSVLNTQSNYISFNNDQQSERYGLPLEGNPFGSVDTLHLARHSFLPRAGPILDDIHPLSSIICPSVKFTQLHVVREWNKSTSGEAGSRESGTRGRLFRQANGSRGKSLLCLAGLH